MPLCSDSFSAAVIKHSDSTQLGEERVVWLTLSGHGTSLWDIGAGTEAEPLKECCLLALSPHAQLSFLMQLRTPSLGWYCPHGLVLAYQSSVKSISYRHECRLVRLTRSLKTKNKFGLNKIWFAMLTRL